MTLLVSFDARIPADLERMTSDLGNLLRSLEVSGEIISGQSRRKFVIATLKEVLDGRVVSTLVLKRRLVVKEVFEEEVFEEEVFAAPRYDSRLLKRPSIKRHLLRRSS